MKPMRLSMGLLVLCWAAGTLAGSPVPVTLKCPVGGKKFTYITTGSLSKWGARPDGKPYGSWDFPIPLPECPGNGLVMYREFSRDEIKTLKKTLETPEYAKLRQQDTPYYRAAWLMSQLQDPEAEQLGMLQQAAWESDSDPQRKARYQQEFVERAAALPKPAAGEDDLSWIATQLRAANALRELGRFDEAARLLESVPKTSLDVPVPEEQVTGTTPSGYGKIISNHAEISAAQGRRSWLGYIEKLGVVIARREPSSEPLDMLPSRVVGAKCLKYPPSTPEYQAICESEPIRAEIERQKKLEALRSPAPKKQE